MTHVRYRLGPPDKPINAQDSDAERKKRQKKKKIYCEEFNAEKGPPKKRNVKKRMYKQSNDNDRDDVVALNYIDGLSGVISKKR